MTFKLNLFHSCVIKLPYHCYSTRCTEQHTLSAMHAPILPAVPPWSLIIYFIILIFGPATSCSIFLAMSLTLAIMYKHYNGFSLTFCVFGIVLSLCLSRNWLLISEQRFLLCTVDHISFFSLHTPFLFLTFLLIYFFLSSVLKQAYRLSLLFQILILQLFLLTWAALTTEEK